MTTYSLPLPKLPDTDDPKLYNQLEPIYLALHSVNNNFLYSCGVSRIPGIEYAKYKESPLLVQPQNLNRLIVTAAETLVFGNLVGLELVAGVVKAKLAKGGPTDAVPALGYCNMPDGAATGTVCEVIISTGLLNVVGATVGTKYYLSDTAGTISSTPPGSGLIQPVGWGILPDYIYISCFDSPGSSSGSGSGLSQAQVLTLGMGA